MKKTVIIINGAGGAGKDTLCAIAARHYAVTSVSAVDRIKEIARFGGWDGVKDERGRKLLSDIKLAFIAYNDLPFASLMEAYRAFCASQARVLLIHCREPKEIAKLQAAIPGSLSLLVRRPGAQSHLATRRTTKWKITATTIFTKIPSRSSGPKPIFCRCCVNHGWRITDY